MLFGDPEWNEDNPLRDAISFLEMLHIKRLTYFK